MDIHIHGKPGYSSSMSSKVDDFGTNRKRICNFLLVININFGRILHRFWDTAIYLLKTAYFPVYGQKTTGHKTTGQKTTKNANPGLKTTRTKDHPDKRPQSSKFCTVLCWSL